MKTEKLIDSFRIDKKQPVDKTEETIRYKTNGSVNSVDSNDDTVAIKIVLPKNSLYKIKCRKSLELYNPLQEGGSYKLSSESFQFKEVNEKCFTNYLQFLKTKQENLFKIAQREVI
jgi:hypothetical protein